VGFVGDRPVVPEERPDEDGDELFLGDGDGLLAGVRAREEFVGREQAEAVVDGEEDWGTFGPDSDDARGRVVAEDVELGGFVAGEEHEDEDVPVDGLAEFVGDLGEEFRGDGQRHFVLGALEELADAFDDRGLGFDDLELAAVVADAVPARCEVGAQR